MGNGLGLSTTPAIRIGGDTTGLFRDGNLLLFWLVLYAPSFLSFLANRTMGPALGWLETPAAIAGSVTCGLTWLLARMLFRPSSDRAMWPWALIAVQFLTAAIVIVAGPAGNGPLIGIVKNVNLLIGPTALVLTLFEPFIGLKQITAVPERRFRWAFAAGYGALLTLSVLLDSSSPATATAIKVGCAAAALVLSGMAVWFREGHPLPQLPAQRKRPPSPDADRLQARILAAVEDRALYTNPDLKVADIARRLGEPAYKVSQCMNGLRGFRNFNQLVNACRIDAAMRLLSDPAANARSVLDIAMDCGFASLGPFNRAFKDRTGMTPTQFRQQCADEPATAK